MRNCSHTSARPRGVVHSPTASKLRVLVIKSMPCVPSRGETLGSNQKFLVKTHGSNELNRPEAASSSLDLRRNPANVRLALGGTPWFYGVLLRVYQIARTPPRRRRARAACLSGPLMHASRTCDPRSLRATSSRSRSNSAIWRSDPGRPSRRPAAAAPRAPSGQKRQ